MKNSNDHEVMSLTTHATCRAAQRNVPPAALEYVLTYGRRIQRTGVTFYFLGRCDMPATDRRASWAAQLEGIVVLKSRDGEVLTIYRQRKALPTIRRKMKYRLGLPTNDYKKHEFR